MIDFQKPSETSKASTLPPRLDEPVAFESGYGVKDAHRELGQAGADPLQARFPEDRLLRELKATQMREGEAIPRQDYKFGQRRPRNAAPLLLDPERASELAAKIAVGGAGLPKKADSAFGKGKSLSSENPMNVLDKSHEMTDEEKRVQAKLAPEAGPGSAPVPTQVEAQSRHQVMLADDEEEDETPIVPSTLMADDDESDVAELTAYFSEPMADHFYTTDDHLASGIDKWEKKQVLCRVYKTKVAGSTPLYLHWSSARMDHMYSTKQAIAGYKRDGIAAYVFSYQVPGSVPLYEYENRRTHDHSYSTHANNDKMDKDVHFNGAVAYVLPANDKAGRAAAGTILDQIAHMQAGDVLLSEGDFEWPDARFERDD